MSQWVFFTVNVSQVSIVKAKITSPPPANAASEGDSPKISQSASVTKKTLRTFANEPKIGSVHMTSTTRRVMETARDDQYCSWRKPA